MHDTMEVILTREFHCTVYVFYAILFYLRFYGIAIIIIMPVSGINAP